MTRALKRSLIAALTLASLPIAAVAAGPAASQWEIGPIIRGKNYSVNMPPTLEEGGGGPGFDFPYPSAVAGQVNYVTVPVRSLAGVRRITLTYRIDAARGVRVVPEEVPGERAVLSLYFQRSGDRWSVRTPHHRWYAPSDRVMPLTPGTHTVTVALDEPWVAMMGGDGHSLPQAFARAKAEAAEVGFVFGSVGGRGHGVYATGPARFTVVDFKIE